VLLRPFFVPVSLIGIFIFLTPGIVVEMLSDEKQSDTRRSRELRFYFMLVVPDEFILIIWALNKEFTG
jgi:hypothetical protein